MSLYGLNGKDKSVSRFVSGGEQRIHVCLENTGIGLYSKEVILANKCSTLLEMRTVYSRNNIDIYYLTDGLETVSDVIEMREDFNIFICITEILHAVKNCEHYLIRTDELVLNSESIYYDQDERKIKLMYMPGNDRTLSVREAIIEIVDRSISCGGIYNGNSEKLINYKKDIFHKNNYSIDDLLRITEEAARYSDEMPVTLIKDETEKETVLKEEESTIWNLQYEKENLIDLGARLKNMITKLVS